MNMDVGLNQEMNIPTALFFSTKCDQSDDGICFTVISISFSVLFDLYVFFYVL